MCAIVNLAPGHCEQIASLHLASFKTRFSGKPGKHLLSCYYQTLTASDGGCGFVAMDGEQILGYVCGIWNPQKIRRQLFRQFGFKLAGWGIQQVILNPSLLKNRRNRSKGTKTASMNFVRYELRPIVVTESARGTGTARQLVDRLLQDAGSRGFDRIFLKTDIDNHQARRFYEKEGFSKIGQDDDYIFFSKFSHR